MYFTSSSPDLSIISDIDSEEISIKSYYYNKYECHSINSFNKNNDEFKFDNISNFNNTYYLSEDILIKNENQNEANQQNFYVEKDNKKNEALTLSDNIKENIINNTADSNTNNTSNSKIIFEINNNCKYDDENENNKFNIFNNGNYDNYSSNMIYETLNDGNKKCKKPIKRKKIFQTNTKKKKAKNIEYRKDNADNKRKKIKVNFHNTLQIAINEKLKRAGSKNLFKALPSSFKSNVTKKNNKAILDLPLKEILLKNKNNKFVLEYLENNCNISEKSNFNKIKNMKYYEIYNEYLLSKEFKFVISTLKEKKESDKYITDYIFKANDLINFFRLEKVKNKDIITTH